MPPHAVVDPEKTEGIRFPCPVCGARIKAAKSKAGQAIDCPRCGERLRVPDSSADEQSPKIDRRTEKKPRRPPRLQREQEAQPTPTAPATVFDRLAEHREIAPDPPPRWTFLSGVFDVVLQPTAVSRWLLLSLGFALTGLVATIVLAMSGAIGFGAGGPPVAVVVAFFVLPLFWLGFYTFSYAAALGMTILEATAAGLHGVSEWPEPNWKEWAGRLLPLVFLFAFAAVPGWGLAETLRATHPEWYWPAIGVVAAVLFPFLLLGSMESGSLFAPVSGVVVGSLLPLWWAWLAYYLLAGGLLTFGGACIWVGWVPLKSPYLTAIVTAPVLAYVTLVEARLLGRLAWRIGERGVVADEDD